MMVISGPAWAWLVCVGCFVLPACPIDLGDSVDSFLPNYSSNIYIIYIIMIVQLIFGYLILC